MVPFAVAGMAIWAVVGLVLLIFFRDWLAAHGHDELAVDLPGRLPDRAARPAP